MVETPVSLPPGRARPRQADVHRRVQPLCPTIGTVRDNFLHKSERRGIGGNDGRRAWPGRLGLAGGGGDQLGPSSGRLLASRLPADVPNTVIPRPFVFEPLRPRPMRIPVVLEAYATLWHFGWMPPSATAASEDGDYGHALPLRGCARQRQAVAQTRRDRR